MIVYRISHTRWATKLSASGNSARWNSKGKMVIYAASSRALACLENVVHRSGEGLESTFKVMLIDIPKRLTISEIKLKDLPKNWFEYENIGICQSIGDKWMDEAKSAVLKVPSAIIPNEFNYVLNTNHPTFKSIKLVGTEPFKFDPRIKN